MLFEYHVIFILAVQSGLGGAPDFESIMEFEKLCNLERVELTVGGLGDRS